MGRATYRAQVIHPLGPRKGFDDVEFATLDRASWFNKRLLKPLGYIPPVEHELAYHHRQAAQS